ncbi:LOW QUALITY PROTEIN: protein mab-21-like 4 [Amazona ochrocephala]
MAARASHWHSSLGAIMPHERQRLEHFQQAEDILLTLLEDVHFRKPCFLVDYARNLEAFELSLASEDAVTMEVPLWTGSDALLVLAYWPGHTPTRHCLGLDTCDIWKCSGTDLEDWTSAVCVMEQEGGEGCLVPVKVLQHLKELVVLAIMCCQYCFLLQPGDLSTENLQEGAMVLSLLIHDGCKAIRFDIVPVKRWQELLQLKGQQSDRGFCEDSLWKAKEEAHYISASPHCQYWEDTGLPVSLARSSTAHTDSWQADLSPRALLQLLTEDRSCSDTACFDILLSQEMPDPRLFQMYKIQDGAHHSGMCQLLSKIQ